MKNFTKLSIEILSNEELMSVRGGDAPVDPIIIKPNNCLVYNSISTTTTTSHKK